MRGRKLNLTKILAVTITCLILVMSSTVRVKACDTATLISYINAVRSGSGLL